MQKFTGNFVYFVEPVIPEKIIRQILQRVGYSVVSETEYIIGGTINIEEAKSAAFELYLTRLYCEKLLCLIKNRSDWSDLLFGELDLEIKNEKENSESYSKRKSQISNSEQTDGTNSLRVDSRISKKMPGKDSERSTAGFGLPPAQHCIKDDSSMDSSYLYSRHLDSDEFLNKYSDLNLAQQPLLPLQNRKNMNPQEIKEELPGELFEYSKFAKPCIPESFSGEPEPDLYEAQDMAYSVSAENADARETVFGHNTLDSKKPLGLNKPATEMNMPNKQTPSKRLVIKLKMGKMADEMAYPIEETLPPDPKEFTYGSNFCYRDPKWKDKEAMEEVNSSASFSSSFSMLNTSTSKMAECGVIDNLHRLREPPSSMYIPPGVTERQCLKITDLQPEENHYQAPSLQGDVVQVNETLYKVHEDTKEDFVMITKKLKP